MIYTVTFNPALDYVVKVDNFTTGTVNRTVSEETWICKRFYSCERRDVPDQCQDEVGQ